MRRISLGLIALIGIMTFCVGVGNLYAESGQWPAQLSIAGFSISGVNGSVRSDGSGSATGNLQIPGGSSERISLSRSVRGDIAGSLSLDGRACNVDMQGNFVLNNNGLTGRGAIKISPKTISDVSINIDSRGQANGNGRVGLSGLSFPISFSISGGSLNGSSSVSDRSQADTPLAVYKFEGNLTLSIKQSRMELTANGHVQRTGKLANQVTNYSISDMPVNISSGQGTTSLGGINVTFKFF